MRNITNKSHPIIQNQISEIRNLIRTKEDLGTGGSYGDAAVDGAMDGGGFKKSVGNFHIKTEFNYTDWDALTLSNVGTATTGSTSITATPEVWSGKIGIGIQF